MSRITPADELQPIESIVTAHPSGIGIAEIGLRDDGGMVRAMLQVGADGLVVEAKGGGHVTPCVADALDAARGTIPMVLAARTGAGESLASTYGFLGSEIVLQRCGLVRSGCLDGIKARMLSTLFLLCRGNFNTEEVKNVLWPWGGAGA
jgi:L-asparaginase